MLHAALIFFASITHLCSGQHFSQTSDVRALSELPLERLLQVRNSLLPAPDIGADFPEQHPGIKVAGRRLGDASPRINEARLGIEERGGLETVPSKDQVDHQKTDNFDAAPDVSDREDDIPRSSSPKGDDGSDDASPRIDVASSKISDAEALPLRAKSTPLNRGGHSGYGGYDDDHSKKGGKIQSIFQISVTTLAFLAFGGYLLCLLVQAVKGKQMDATTLAPMVAAFYRPRPRPSNRRRTTRRPPRSGHNRRPSYRNSKGAKGGKRRGGGGGKGGGSREGGGRSRREAEVPPLEHLDLDRMYDSLISLSEAYVKYHTVDYKFYNRTGKLYN